MAARVSSSFLLALLFGCAACLGDPAGVVKAERLGVTVLAEHPHDAQAFTQGLVWQGGALVESTGLYGQSSVRRVSLETGLVEQQLRLTEEFFGEGIALVGEKLYLLTWQSQLGFVLEAQSFAEIGQFSYEGEGWGLCYDGGRLVMSDGSDTLSFRDAASFAELGRVRVTLDGAPIASLNELECVGGKVYANVWQSDSILRIDPASGRVEALIDASGVWSAGRRRVDQVLNGIAYDPAREVFYLTGKMWPSLYEVKFVPAT